MNGSRVELKYELISDRLYTDVVIVPLDKSPNQVSGFIERDPIEMYETAEFESNSGSPYDKWWTLHLYPYHFFRDRKKLLNIRYVKLYKYLYEVDPDKDPWLNGRAIYRRPLFDGHIFERPGDITLRGYNNRVAFFKRKNLNEKKQFED